MAAGGFHSMNKADWGVLGLFFVGAVIMRAAGCVINDLWDRDIDRQIERTRQRPIACGDISVRAGIIFLIALLFGGLLILAQMNFVTVLLGLISVPLIGLYPLMKRWTWWPQAFLGLTFNFGALMGWSAITGALGLPAILLYVSGVLWTLGYDTIYAHQDMEDDMMAGIKSTALKFGAASHVWVSGFYSLSWACLAAAILLSGAPIYSIVFLVPAAAHLFFQLKSWSVEDAPSALRTFKSNRDYGFLVLAGLALVSLV